VILFSSRHTAELAQAVVDVGAVPLLVLCVQVNLFFSQVGKLNIYF